MNWTIVEGLPIWQQLVQHLTHAIATAHYPPGSRIPSVRDLALEAGVNPNTMQRALVQLEGDGLVTTNRTAGRQVTEDTTILENLRKQLASDAVRNYLTQMALLGFGAQEAAAILNQKEELL